ncbi:MAG: SipW-dependent-type signal peptide-containing protein [Clostridiales bacterium]|nr:SipW-dependent-type signal peptide-containing protein [Clostridiales bacterium]
MSRKKVILTTVILILILIIIRKTLAYMTDSKEISNTFTDGKVKISLTEPSYDEEKANKIEIGETLSQDPTITNIGDIDSYVFIETKIPGAAIDTNMSGKSDSDNNFHIKENFKYQINNGWKEVISPITPNDCECWHLYAYVDSNGKMKKLKPNESTTALFNEVTLIPSEYYGTTDPDANTFHIETNRNWNTDCWSR